MVNLFGNCSICYEPLTGYGLEIKTCTGTFHYECAMAECRDEAVYETPKAPVEEYDADGKCISSLSLWDNREVW